jgi:hypothetical protein
LVAGGCGSDDDGNDASPTETATVVPTEVPTAPPTETAVVVPTETAVPAPTNTPGIESGPIAMRRLTEAQYRSTIAAILGDDIVVAGRIEPDNRRDGLLAVGSSFVSVTASGFEQYDSIARSVAEQAVDAAHRDALVPCQPQSASAPDDDCTEQFILEVGRRLLRRPIGDDDVATGLGLAYEAATGQGDFYAGIETVLTWFLLSPEFLFRVEATEADPAGTNQRLDDVSMASRLSYFLWNSAPDDELLEGAEHGELVDDDGLALQVDRMLASPRLEASIRAFFSDLYDFEQIEQGLVRKDPALFPVFTQTLIQDAREQTLRVIVDHLLTEDGDYRDLFTTRKSFMTRPLGIAYRVPVATRNGFEPFEFPDDGERAGLMTHLSLLSLYSHPGRSSPTLRGKFVREVLLCQDVPPPPGDIDFSEFAEEGAENRKTARQRLEIHVSNSVCAGCHSLMDPIGLGFENMDGIGIFRETENGVQIDSSGTLDGVPFDDAVGLGEVLSRHPGLGPCYVRSLYRFAMGRNVVPGEEKFLRELQEQVEASGYLTRDLLRAIAMSEAFRTTSGPLEAQQEPTPDPKSTPVSTPTPRPPTSTPDPNATSTHTPEPTATPAGATLQQLQEEFFTLRCATQFCHSRQTQSGGLILEEGDSFANLVGVAPQNAAAQSAGMLRVDPGDPDNSYLLLKLSGLPDSSFGAPMPLVGDRLTEDEVDSIRSWILAGANP